MKLNKKRADGKESKAKPTNETYLKSAADMSLVPASLSRDIRDGSKTVSS